MNKQTNSVIVSTKKLFKEKLIYINRVCKTVKGGRIFSFTALTVIGNCKGQVGYGYSKGKEIPIAINKSLLKAKKNIYFVHIKKKTILHTIKSSYNSSYIVLLPAKEGTGIIAGKVMRAILELAGIYNVVGKIYGSNNPINVLRATIKGLTNMTSIQDIANKRNKDINEILK